MIHSFDNMLPVPGICEERKNSMETESGWKVLENGEIYLRICAPGTEKVVVISEETEQELRKNKEGYFEGTFSGAEGRPGLYYLDFLFDGSLLLSADFPVVWTKDRLSNYLEIPDPETPWIRIRHVPHGSLTRELFYSEALKQWQRCLIYTPPGYGTTEEIFPVLYLQHGGTENETSWVCSGKMPCIMDNLLEDGQCRPFITVMCDGTAVYDKEAKYRGEIDRAFEDMLIHDCMPFVEKKYRAGRDKWNRALAGLSMGAFQTGCIGLGHPELFGSLGIFSGSFTENLWGGKNTYAGRLLEDGWLESEYRLFFRSIGEEDHISDRGFERDSRMMEENGLDRLACCAVRRHSGRGHEWGAWRRAFYEFAKLLFREERKYISAGKEI